MLLYKRPIVFIGFAAALLSWLTSCANSTTGKALERSLAVDPQLKDNPTLTGNSQQSTPQNQTSAQLPEDFPSEIPLYPEAQLQNAEPLTVPDAQGQRTTWSSSDPSNFIQSFYKKTFESGNWQVVAQPNPNDEVGGTFVARQNDLQLTVSISPSAATSSPEATPTSTPSGTGTDRSDTTFEIQYIRKSDRAAVKPSNPQAPGEATSEPATQSTGTLPTASQAFADLDRTPQGLRQYVEDVVALGVLTVNPSADKNNPDTSGTQFEPNKTITRREYARWLVAANNRLYANNPGKQIRLASATDQPTFQDVPKTDPDFPSIQALAEAGLIPSPLTGDATAVQFRPDAPLTRENLILWKVPLDTRQALPSAAVDAVKQTWGFQDAGKIDPKALKAVLGDFQNGDQANIRRVFGYTTLFQPKKPVTRAEAAAALWYFGFQGEGVSAQEAQSLKPSNSSPEPTPGN
ncbi:MAG TPA: S-layer protein [Cyanobacteria bacterium UBA8803]|nr:S-layer protein [Cyanobacteria bacterium UBA9273]HBL60129.1 S-layer protein [Cyanobacteria bacterium UBA8803]